MTYYSVVEHLATNYCTRYLLALCFIFCFFSGLYIICYAETNEDPFMSKKSQFNFNFVAAGDFGVLLTS
jgi:hypothetical protein